MPLTREPSAPITADLAAVRQAVQTVLVGQDAALDGVLLALLTGGHVFLEGVPGVGKTLLIKTLAGCLDATFSRVQCTPDLSPLDLLGTAEAVGPIMAHLVLMDEINRAQPRFQSALLEAMQERQVTYAGTPRPLPSPFLVLATQNPIESEGTYPLPEAQLDRFLLKLLVPPPPPEDLTEILRRTTVGAPVTTRPQFTLADVRRWQATVRDLPVPPWLLAQAVALVRASHPDDPTAPDAVRRYVLYGSSPRGGQALIVGAKALACLTGKPLSPAHVAAVAPAALRHRLCLNFTGAAAGITPDVVVEALLSTVASDTLVARRDP